MFNKKLVCISILSLLALYFPFSEYYKSYSSINEGLLENLHSDANHEIIKIIEAPSPYAFVVFSNDKDIGIGVFTKGIFGWKRSSIVRTDNNLASSTTVLPQLMTEKDGKMMLGLAHSAKLNSISYKDTLGQIIPLDYKDTNGLDISFWHIEADERIPTTNDLIVE